LTDDYILVSLQINKDVKIKTDSTIAIKDSTMLGGKHVEITRGSRKASPITLGQILKGEPPRNMMEGLNRAAGQAGEMIKENRGNLKETISSTRDITEKIKSGKGTVGKLINEDKVHRDLEATMSNAREATESLKNILGKVEKGEGSVGKFVHDDEFFEKASETIDALRDYTGKVIDLKTYIGLNTTYFEKEEMNISEVYFRIEPGPNKYYLLGASVFSLQDGSPLPHNKDDDHIHLEPNIELAYKFFKNRLTLRGGIMEGKPGGGIDYDLLGGKLRFSVEGRDTHDDSSLDEEINSMLLRTSITTTFWNGRIQLKVGLNNILEKSSFIIGIGFDFQDNDIKYVVGALGSGV